MKFRTLGRFWRRHLLVLGADGWPVALFTGRTEAERAEALAVWMTIPRRSPSELKT